MLDTKKRVLLIGLEPTVVDYTRFPGLNAGKVLAALKADEANLNTMGYDAQLCFVDLGETAETTVVQKLSEGTFDCVLIGAGIRTVPEHSSLFEQLINVVHQYAPSAKLCFNTNPSDTAKAVQRWV